MCRPPPLPSLSPVGELTGCAGWRPQEFREPRLDPQVVTKFVPSLVSLMVDDQVRALNQKLPPDERASAITIIEHSGEIPEPAAASQTQRLCVLRTTSLLE